MADDGALDGMASVHPFLVAGGVRPVAAGAGGDHLEFRARLRRRNHLLPFELVSIVIQSD